MSDQVAMTRVTVPNDRQLLDGVRLALDMWQESPVYGRLPPPSVDRLIEQVYIARIDPDQFVHVAVDDDDTCHGFLIGALAPIAFTEGKYAFERMLYVRPQRRGTDAARLLVEAFEQWARDVGAVYALFGTTTGVDTRRTEHFYNKLGYRTVGVLTMKEM